MYDCPTDGRTVHEGTKETVSSNLMLTDGRCCCWEGFIETKRMSAIVERPSSSSSDQGEANQQVISKTLDCDEIPVFEPVVKSEFIPNDSVTVCVGLEEQDKGEQRQQQEEEEQHERRQALVCLSGSPHDDSSFLSTINLFAATDDNTEEASLLTGLHSTADVSALIAEQVHRTTAALLSDNNDETSALIAEATAAAIEAAAGVATDSDATAAVAAAVSATLDMDVGPTICAAPTLVLLKAHDEYNELQYQLQLQQLQQPGSDEAAAKKNEHRRRRYREKNLNESDDVSRTESRRSGTSSTGTSRDDTLASRRLKDRERYANMTPEQRMVYNAKRREQYHRQSEISRQKRRARERSRYHALTLDKSKERNERRARLERERYQRLKPEDLEAKNRRRRERAALARQLKEAQMANGTEGSDATVKAKKRRKTNSKRTSDVASQNESMLPISTSPTDILLPTTPMVTMLTADNTTVQSFELIPVIPPAPVATSNPSPTTVTDISLHPIHVNNNSIVSATFTTGNIISSTTS